MSTSEILHAKPAENRAEAPVRAKFPPIPVAQHASVPAVDEQISRMIQQLFFLPSARPLKQVVFCGVDEDTDVSGICMQAAQSLSLMVGASIAVAEAKAFFRSNKQSDAPDIYEDLKHIPGQLGTLRQAADQLSANLWALRGTVLWSSSASPGSPAWIQGRLRELRLDFDYALLHAPPPGLCSETALLGQACDGVILVLEANITRKSAALKAREILRASNVRILGTVLSGRTFPIPESIYRRI